MRERFEELKSDGKGFSEEQYSSTNNDNSKVKYLRCSLMII